MKQLTGLTDMEKQVMTAFIDGLYAEAGFSDIDANDLNVQTEIPMKAIRGVISSLIKKGIVFVEKGAANGTLEIIHLQESFYGLHPQWAIDENVERIEIV
jgi:hypothetical protein